MLRRTLIWLTMFCFVTTQTGALSGASDEGAQAGKAANASIRGAVTAPNASANVPGYTRTPPERGWYGQPSLSTPAGARLAACASTPDDPVCQAQRGAVSSANTAREGISPHDPSVTAARDIT